MIGRLGAVRYTRSEVENRLEGRLITYTTGASAIFPAEVAVICSMSLGDPIAGIPKALLEGTGQRTAVQSDG